MALISVDLLLTVTVAACAILVLIYASGEAVERVLALLDHFGLSATFGGLTIFSLMTSLPELFSHIAASVGILSGDLDYAIGSATVLGANIGSDIVQQTLVLGLVVLMMGGLQFERSFLLTAYLPMIATTLMCLALGWDGTYSRLDGGFLLATFAAYIVFLYRREEHEPRPERRTDVRALTTSAVVLGLFVLVLASAHVLLVSTEIIVTQPGLGGSLIGVVSLGVASAAPEMFTALSGMRRGETGISVGTLIGSNITNPLVAIGLGAVLSTYAVPRPLVLWDLPTETVSAALLLAYLLLKNRKGWLGRGGGIYLVGLYFIYLAARVVFFHSDG